MSESVTSSKPPIQFTDEEEVWILTQVDKEIRKLEKEVSDLMKLDYLLTGTTLLVLRMKQDELHNLRQLAAKFCA